MLTIRALRIRSGARASGRLTWRALRRAIVLAVVSVAAALRSLTLAQQMSDVVRSLDRAEQAFRSYRMEWTLQEETRISAEDHAQLEQMARNMRQAMQAKGIPSAVIEREVNEAVQKQAKGSHRVTQSTWTVEWGADFLHVSGSRELGEQTGSLRFHSYFGDGWIVEYADPSSNRWAREKGGKVFCVPSQGYRYQSPDQGALDVLPAELALLAGLNPLRIGNSPRWEAVKQSANEWWLETTLHGPISAYRLQIHLDPRRGYALSGFTCRSLPDEQEWQVRCMVTKHEHIGGQWLPAQAVVEGSYLRGRQQRWRLWKLKSVTSATSVSFMIPTGIPLLDYRLAGCDLFSTQQMFAASEEGHTVGYLSKGHLPSLPDLQQMRARQSGGQTTRTQASHWWRLIPPILLITAGLLWYWRLKVKKVS